MQDEKQIVIGSENDPDNPRKALSSIGNRRIQTPPQGFIIYIPWERTKFACPYHKMRTLINMSDSASRDKSNKMEEFSCICGVIYIRTQDLRKVSSEFRR